MYRIFLVFRFRGINEEGYGRMLAKQFVANEKHPILGTNCKGCLNIYRVDDNQIHKKTQTIEI